MLDLHTRRATQLIALASIFVVQLSGCSTSPALDWAKPVFIKRPKNVEPWYVTMASVFNRNTGAITSLESRYNESASPDERRALRNEFVGEVMIVITEYHNAQMEHLRANKAFQGTFFDFAVLGLTTAGTVLGGEGLKAALHAAAAGTKGAELAIDENFFQDQTMGAIQDQMDALREEEMTSIKDRMADPVADYPLSVAKNDLLDLFFAGSVNRAIRAIASDAAAKKDKAEKKSRGDGGAADG